ncbi:chloramphenicol O-acetyltransferase type B [Methanococcus voltae]|uniref:Chloramphenicol acetyltransferase n=3 Tax=Methanococcus voltae TaxID=2188 RepID=A0A8J7RHK0_METVO|nr:CatB-related O-acetyltransferase [Methanococcus voltae]MBP2201982.1 chloramphenicol O-acetyltransferase type B [Methanococcus voltae]MCS3922145.1 chloramphenicol O-acetyltransferase type B [Methanococcus voltae PS]
MAKLFNSYRDIQIMNIDNSSVHDFGKNVTIEEIDNPLVEIGEYTYYSGYYHGHSFRDCIMYLDEQDKGKDVDKLIIGKFCSIASGVKFIMGGNQGHRYDYISAYPLSIVSNNPIDLDTEIPESFVKKGDTIIGNDVWIGAESLIMPGVKIGDGAVIGTRSLVTKDVAPYTIVGGCPAKVIKKRFSNEKIELLLNIKWWNWDIEKIRASISILMSDNFEALKGLEKL